MTYSHSNEKIPVAILGATGAVGQKAIALLEGHPIFRISQLAASNAKAGQRYADVVNWREASPLSAAVANLPLVALHDVTCPVALSALPASVANNAELALADRGIHIFSNAAAHRMDPTVPILIPEVNMEHLALLKEQQRPGKITTNSNCAVAVIAPVIAAALSVACIRHIGVVTLQAVSGAGAHAVDTFDTFHNIIPHISGEADKIVSETRKICDNTQLPMTVQVHRIPLLHGHMAAIQIQYATSTSAAEVAHAIAEQAARYPATYVVYDDQAMPQPAHTLNDRDMCIHIGGIRQGGDGDTVAITTLAHNLVRGAAGATIANMEAVVKAGAVDFKAEALI